MAERSGFFPYVAGNSNSEYDSTFLAQWIASIVGNGVYDGELAVTPGDHMQVIIPAGRAWINGYHYRNDGDLAIAIANADGVLHRKDTVVLRWDVNARSITAQVLQGTPASDPIAPQITRSAEQYDLKIAEISIPAGTTAITQALITDTRLDSSVCGIVTGVIDQVDTTTLYNQIQADLEQFQSVNEAEYMEWSAEQRADYEEWLAGIRGILGEDEAGNLLNMIQAHEADAVAHVTQADHDKINAAAAKSTPATATLPASGWTGTESPYSITVSIAGAKPEPTRIEVQPTTDATAAQWGAWRAALIRGGGQGADSITLLADGDKPEIDIPIAVTIRGDVS